MKKLLELLEKRWAAYTFALCSAVVLYLLLTHLDPLRAWVGSLGRLLSPVVIGLVLAYLMDPVSDFMERKLFARVKKESARHSLAVVVAVVLVLLSLGLFFALLIPSLNQSITSLLGNAKFYLQRAEEMIDRLSKTELAEALSLEDLTDTLDEKLNDLFSTLVNNLTAILSQVGAFGGAVFNWLIGLILAIYFLMGKKNLMTGLEQLRRAAMTEKTYARRTNFWRRCNQIFLQYIGCSLLDALIVGVSNALFMSIMQMPYTPLVSVVVGVTNLLPTFGPFIGGAIGAFILVLHRPILAVWFLLFTLILQTIDGYVIKPRLFSSSLGIPAVWSLIAIILGGKLMGVVGILLSIPVAAVFTMLYTENFIPWLQSRRAAREAQDK